jgi:hypothetical protein
MKEASSERGEAFIFLAPCSPLGEGSSPPLAVHQNGMRTPGELVERFPEVSPCLPLPPPASHTFSLSWHSRLSRPSPSVSLSF